MGPMWVAPERGFCGADGGGEFGGSGTGGFFERSLEDAVPHSIQNLAPFWSSCPQLEQLCIVRVPHSPQNFALGSSVAPHFVQPDASDIVGLSTLRPPMRPVGDREKVHYAMRLGQPMWTSITAEPQW